MTSHYVCSQCNFEIVTIKKIGDMGSLRVGGRPSKEMVKRDPMNHPGNSDNPQKLMLERKHPSGVCPRCGRILNYTQPSKVKVGYKNKQGETVWISSDDILRLMKE